jgi:hypothetical protein
MDFLIRTHGQDAVLALIDAYADGRTDDEAFSLAIGQDLAAFDAAWLAAVPARLGPQPAPPGPRPADWGAGGASPLPGATSVPGPAATPVTGPADDPAPILAAGSVLPILLVAGLLGLACVGLVVARRGGRPVSS